MFDRSEKGELIGLLKITVVLLILFLVFGARFLVPKDYWYVEVVATIYPCTNKNDVWTYVSDFRNSDEIYICGTTNKSSTKFELRIFQLPHGNLVYLDSITASEDKTIQFHVDYELPAGVYSINLLSPRKILSTATFTVTQE